MNEIGFEAFKKIFGKLIYAILIKSNSIYFIIDEFVNNCTK